MFFLKYKASYTTSLYTHIWTTTYPREVPPVFCFHYNGWKRWETNVPRSFQEKVQHFNVAVEKTLGICNNPLVRLELVKIFQGNWYHKN